MYDVDTFITEADAVAVTGYSEETVDAIEAMLRRLAAESSGLIERKLGSLHDDAAAAEILAEGVSGSALMLARFSPEAPTPVHNHNSWGVVLVLSGTDRYERWRVEPGQTEDQATVTMLESLELGPGDSVLFPPPPQDLHAQQGIDEAAWELVFFAANPMCEPRAYYDPEAGTVRYGMP